MTTELYPFIGPDMTYDQQRKCRMQDAIDDYLQDDQVDSRRTYEEMLSCIQDVIDYHRNSMERATVLKSLMMGNRFVDDMDSPWDSE